MPQIQFESIVQELKSRVDIVDVVSRYIELDATNKALCPFHADTNPSFSIHREKHFFHCFGCGKAGDVITFLQLIEGSSFMEVLRTLARQVDASVPLTDHEVEKEIESQRLRKAVLQETVSFYERNLSAEACGYLHGRGVTDGTVSRFRIGFGCGGLAKCLIDEGGFSHPSCIDAGVRRTIDQGIMQDFFYN